MGPIDVPMMGPPTVVRAFVAVELPSAVVESLLGLQRLLREAQSGASWLRRNNLHLTLKFLGDVRSDRLDTLRASLREDYSIQRPFDVRIRGSGAFPNLRRPAVLWAGIADSAGRLDALRQLAETAAATAGIETDRRSFRPHVTLGRIRGSRDVSPALERIFGQTRDFKGGDFTVCAVSLFKSTLNAGGAIHEVLDEYPLDGHRTES